MSDVFEEGADSMVAEVLHPDDPNYMETAMQWVKEWEIEMGLTKPEILPQKSSENHE